MTKRFNAFTLAEVLITLGIIGVVAAMTMPTLMNQTNGAQYKAAYKKALSAISQAVTLNVALDDVSFADTTAGTAGTTGAPASGASIASLLNSRMNVVKAVSKTNDSAYTRTDSNTADSEKIITDDDTHIYFNDGSMLAFNATNAAACTQTAAAADDNKICDGFIDVNGTKGPNKVVKCDGTADSSCVVTSPTDIYPVQFYDQTILPASYAAKAVLYGK